MKHNLYIGYTTLLLALFSATGVSAQTQSHSVPITIHYRWDRSELDRSYLTNGENLARLDSVLHLPAAEYIDTIRITAYASPEGGVEYNQRLSERRAKTIRGYLLANYTELANVAIVTDARGENWQGFMQMALNDPNLPMRERVLEILQAPISDTKRQSEIERLDGGRVYRNCILPNYYRYLRSAASLFILYSPDMPVEAEPDQKPEPERKKIEAVEYIYPEVEEPEYNYARYPIALKTNLLYDALGAFNISAEIPLGKFSAVAEFVYGYWRTDNRYALQTLQGSVEVRYWFGVSERQSYREQWQKPLRGWNVGTYFTYCSRYDVQWQRGYQGDGYRSAGITAGYAVPIGKNFSLDFSLAGGYLFTPEYRYYHPQQEGHLMWQETGSWSGLTLTRVQLSLVWLIEKGGRR